MLLSLFIFGRVGMLPLSADDGEAGVITAMSDSRSLFKRRRSFAASPPILFEEAGNLWVVLPEQ